MRNFTSVKRAGIRIIIPALSILLILFFICRNLSLFGKSSGEYGVFLGLNGNELSHLADYRIVVIEPAEFTTEQIDMLHKEGKTVYAYLNIGALEDFRPYYDRFSDRMLDPYEGWPEEHWMDVTDGEWQDLIAELGENYAHTGYDGFFLDNADVYYHYPSEDVFHSLCSVLERLKKYGVTLIINGGDSFVTRSIDEGVASALFDGINQESVFTDISSENGLALADTTAYYQEYLQAVHDSGLSVYLLEYRVDAALSYKIDAYCRQNGFLWYNADSLELR